MSLLYFLIILSVLVIVHELGHFLIAKYFDIRVDEFGLGYPPRALKLFKWRETLFTLNWLPFGGFVKIFGENPNEEEKNIDPRSFSSKNRGAQAAVLVAGVTFNFIFAWLLISLGFMSGLPAPAGLDLPVTEVHTVITTVLPDSPADKSGIKSGDTLLSLSRNGSQSEISPEGASTFIGKSNEELIFTIKRGKETLIKIVKPEENIVEGKTAVGISMDNVGTVTLSPLKAFSEGLKVTGRLTILTAESLTKFLYQTIIGKADFKEVTGPVGLVGMVGDVKALGFVYLLSFTALISINLSVVNLLPIPALDGGRLLFVIIESILRRPVSPKLFNMANNLGFVLLLILMVVVTFRDVMHLI